MKSKKGIIYKRRQQILEELRNNQTVNVEQLSNQLTVSPVTIRRDLDVFEQEGIVKRFYGGANLIEGSLSEDPFQNNDSTAELSDKSAIAKKAAELVEDGDTIFLNSSSTALLMLQYLTDKRVNVVTNNGNALTIKRDSMIELFLTGGEVYSYKNSLVGDVALQMIRKMHADKCFIGVSGINEKGEITTSVLQETMINSLMMERCDGTIVILADSKKLGMQNNFTIASLDQISHLITDNHADESVLSKLERPNLTIIKAMG